MISLGGLIDSFYRVSFVAGGYKIMAKNIALEKIESHEKLCRIMQKQTHDKINGLQGQINRIERILLVSAGALMSGMAGVIIVLLQKL